MRLKAFIILLGILSSSLLRAQDSISIQMVLERISSRQITQDSFFLKGIFPSYISKHHHTKFTKGDNNIFYNALVSYTLQNFKSELDSNQKLLVKEINNKSLELYPKFRNKKGRNTYNFWRTDTLAEFPYSKLIARVKKDAALPDDLDDTVLSLMALNVSDSTAEAVHQLMQSYINCSNKKFRNSIKEYKSIPAYSAWYGKKFPVVFDICVLSNILTFVQKNNLKWTKADSASLQVILTSIQKKHYLHNGKEVSPYYIKPSVSLYHFARLMSVKKIDALEAFKPELIQAAEKEFHKSNNLLEKIILSSALMKWGSKPPSIVLEKYKNTLGEIDNKGIPFFVGNIPSYLPRTYKKSLTALNWGLYDHHCPAYNEVLLLEYLILSKRTNTVN